MRNKSTLIIVLAMPLVGIQAGAALADEYACRGRGEHAESVG